MPCCNDGPIRSFAKLVRGENLWLLSSGALAADSAKLLNSERLKTRFAELRKEFDFVLIDAPPLTPLLGRDCLGQLTDGFVTGAGSECDAARGGHPGGRELCGPRTFGFWARC